MICPACGFENIQGVDQCDNCGADLRTADIPAPSTRFEADLVSRSLATLQPPPHVTIGVSASAGDAVRLMHEHGIGCVVVEDGGGVRGILSERDLVLKLSDGRLEGVTVGQLMTQDPVVLRPDDSVAVAIHKMAVGGFRHIPLVENGHSTGLVAAQDVFRHILRTLD